MTAFAARKPTADCGMVSKAGFCAVQIFTISFQLNRVNRDNQTQWKNLALTVN